MGEKPVTENITDESGHGVGAGVTWNGMRPQADVVSACVEWPASSAQPRRTPSPQTDVRKLDWSNFAGPKRNPDWKPDDQDLIYTAINFRDDEWGDADEDAGQQIVERLLQAWQDAEMAAATYAHHRREVQEALKAAAKGTVQQLDACNAYRTRAENAEAALVSTSPQPDVVDRFAPITDQQIRDIMDCGDPSTARIKICRLIYQRTKPAPQVLSRGAQNVLAERRRQIEVENFDASHDDMATKGQLATAAACYAFQAGARGRRYPGAPEPVGIWPWDREWWKPSADHRRNLIKAGALILAEIERLDRAALAATEDRS